jgi:hypothetical protein
MTINGSGYTIFDPRASEVGESSTRRIANFLDAVAAKPKPNSGIEEGQKSTLLCHLGNIAYRTGRTLTLDPKTRTIVGDKEATALRGREYQKGWEPKVS